MTFTFQITACLLFSLRRFIKSFRYMISFSRFFTSFRYVVTLFHLVVSLSRFVKSFLLLSVKCFFFQTFVCFNPPSLLNDESQNLKYHLTQFLSLSFLLPNNCVIHSLHNNHKIVQLMFENTFRYHERYLLR